MGRDTIRNKKKVGGLFGSLREAAAKLNKNRAVGQAAAPRAEENIERVRNEDDEEQKQKRQDALSTVYGPKKKKEEDDE